MPIHVREAICLTLLTHLKCKFHLDTRSRTHPEIIFNQISGHPMTQVVCYVKLTITVVNSWVLSEGKSEERMQTYLFVEFIPRRQMQKFLLMKDCKLCRWKWNGYNNDLNINCFAFHRFSIWSFGYLQMTLAIGWVKLCCSNNANAKSLQLCLTLCDPMDCSPPGYSAHWTLQARILEWVAMPSLQ